MQLIIGEKYLAKAKTKQAEDYAARFKLEPEFEFILEGFSSGEYLTFNEGFFVSLKEDQFFIYKVSEAISSTRNQVNELLKGNLLFTAVIPECIFLSEELAEFSLTGHNEEAKQLAAVLMILTSFGGSMTVTSEGTFRIDGSKAVQKLITSVATSDFRSQFLKRMAGPVTKEVTANEIELAKQRMAIKQSSENRNKK